MTRAFAALAHMDIISAIRYNPVSPAVFLVMIVLWGYSVARLVTAGRFVWRAWPSLITERVFWALLIIYLAFGITRLALEIHNPEMRLPAANITTYNSI